MIIVLDTNVLISGIFWSGPPSKILQLVENGDEIQLAQSYETFEEFEEVLQRGKFSQIVTQRKLDIPQILESLFTVSEFYLISRVNSGDVEKEINIEDADDLKFVELAIAAGARYIVSGDPHLLKIKKYKHIDIINPTEFLEIISSS